jgi:hypothetical protein
MYEWLNIEARSRNRCCSGKAVSITYSACVCVCVCVFVALVILHENVSYYIIIFSIFLHINS